MSTENTEQVRTTGNYASRLLTKMMTERKSGELKKPGFGQQESAQAATEPPRELATTSRN